MPQPHCASPELSDDMRDDLRDVFLMRSGTRGPNPGSSGDFLCVLKGGGGEEGSALNEWGGRAQTAGGSKHSSEATQAGPAP